MSNNKSTHSNSEKLDEKTLKILKGYFKNLPSGTKEDLEKN